MALDPKQEVINGLQTQASAERIGWSVDFTDQHRIIGGSLGSPKVTVYDEAGDEDVTSIAMHGVPKMGTGTQPPAAVYLPGLMNLKRLHTYRVEVTVNMGGNTVMGYFRVRCVR